MTATAAASTLAGCGWYTNLPANIMVKEIDPSAVTINYTTTTSSGTSTTTAQYTQPSVVLEGAPGSVGVTYTLLTITYYQTNNAASASVVSSINPVFSSQTIRVDSSALRSNYLAGNQDMVGLDPSATNNQKQPLVIGVASASLPVVDADVVHFGSPSSGSTAKQIYADVALDGIDDAHIKSHLEFEIPISFVNTTNP